MFRIRDIIHGYIPLDEEDEPLLACPYIQRLRYIRQNDLGYLVFPTLNTSRFEHSLGVMHLAGQLAENALRNAGDKPSKTYMGDLWNVIPAECRNSINHNYPELRGSFRRAARWYGLLHDVGHLPFSHLTEHAITSSYKGKNVDIINLLYGNDGACNFTKLHEAAAYSIVKSESVRAALSIDRQAAWMVEQLLRDKKSIPTLQPLKDIVDSEVDADRIDSTARDGRLSGGDFGNYDIPRLIQNVQLVKHRNAWRTMFSTRTIGPMEGLLLERYKTHRWIHFHPKVMALKNAFRYCISKLEWPPESWKQDRYFEPNRGFLDDASILRALWEMQPTAQPIAHARSAILLREETASPLWKRTDEFHQYCDRIANLKAEWIRDNQEHPILNRFAGYGTDLLEERLNENPPSGVHYLVGQTKIKLIELREDDVIRKSEYYILPESGEPTSLTQQSGLVENLPEIIKREPIISVSVLGDTRSEKKKDEIKDHFISVATALFNEQY